MLRIQCKAPTYVQRNTLFAYRGTMLRSSLLRCSARWYPGVDIIEPDMIEYELYGAYSD